MTLADLIVPKGFTEADSLINDLDNCLFNGFARLGREGKAGLERMAAVFDGSPLGTAVKTAVDQFASGNFNDDAFAAIAAARLALLGAQYDALAMEVKEKMGLDWLETPDTVYRADPPGIYAGVRSWLAEMGIRGLGQADQESILSFGATLDALLPQPEAIRLGAILTGLINEMEACLPFTAENTPPVRRWADLWSRSMILSKGQPEQILREEITGELFLLGTDIRQQGHGVRLRIYGVLCCKDTTRCVCVNLFAFKVPTITGVEIWKLFEAYPKLLTAVANWQRVTIKKMALTADGNLIWDEAGAELDLETSPFDTADKYLPCPQSKMPAIDRHPVQFATPVLLDGYDCALNEQELCLNDGPPLSFHGTGTASALTPEAVEKGAALIALLRFDGGRWEIQPLTLRTKGKKFKIIHNGPDPAKKPKGKGAAKKKSPEDSLSILRERAGKLLRK